MKDGVSGRFFPGDFLPAAHWGCLGRCRHLGSTLWAEHRRSPAAGSGAEPRESGAHWHSDDLQPGLCLDWGCHGISFGAAQSEYLRSLNHSEPTKKIGASTFPMVNVLFFEENAESAVNVPIANFCIEGIAQETWDLRPHTHIYWYYIMGLSQLWLGKPTRVTTTSAATIFLPSFSI